MSSGAVSPDEVLDFWFGADDEPVAAKNARWFGASDEVDRIVRERFGAASAAAVAGQLDAWAGEPRGWLALLILLDQFPRNIHRAGPLAFAGDVHARAIAAAGIARGDDYQLKRIERLFCYLPFEHAEDLAAQEHAVRLVTALRDEMPPVERGPYDDFLGYAIRHRDVIERFGRFPHRNRVLGRTDTPEEHDYLREPDAGF